MRRVVVTGLGVVSPVGVGVDRAWDSMIAGRSGIGPITHFDVTDFSTRFGGQVDEFDPTEWLSPKEARRLSRFQQFAVAAADEAIADSGLTITDEIAERVGVIVGAGIGGLATMEEQTAVLLKSGPSRVSPFLVPMMIIDLAAGHISIRHNLRGINYAPVSACATGNHAIGEAAECIKRGAAEVIVAGGFDCGLTPLGLAGFSSARALSARNDDPQAASRPFDVGRDGFVIGEGGAVLILEEMEFAKARKARILAELVGYGASADAYHITAPAPDGSGAKRAMTQALDQAGFMPSDVSYINAHGTSTPLGDIAETSAIKSVFADSLPVVSSTKSMTGHLLGGAGALEAVVSVMSLMHDIVPPTINLVDPDPQCDLDYVPNTARKMTVNAAMSNSFGFGGHNATLLFTKARP